MKICFLSPHIYNLVSNKRDGFGGAEVDIFNLTKELAKDKNFKISIVCVTNDLKKPRVFSRVLLVPLRISQPMISRWRLLCYYKSLYDILKKQNADIYFSALASLASIIAFLAAKINRKKFIFRIFHDWETNHLDLKNKIFSQNKSWVGKLFPKLFILSLKYSDLIFVSKESEKQALVRNFRIEPNKIFKTSNIVENIFTGDKLPSFILWINRMHPMKRPKIFLDLAKLFPKEKFVMIAPLNKDYEDLFEETKKEAEKIENLQFIDGVPRNEVNYYYQRAKMFVLTSEAEGQSNVLIESLRTATPVISLSFDPDHILTNNKIGFCANGDFNKMAKDVQLLNDDENLWREYSQNAYNFAKKNFDIQKIIKDYKKVFYELTKRN